MSMPDFLPAGASDATSTGKKGWADPVSSLLRCKDMGRRKRGKSEHLRAWSKLLRLSQAER